MAFKAGKDAPLGYFASYFKGMRLRPPKGKCPLLLGQLLILVGLAARAGR